MSLFARIFLGYWLAMAAIALTITWLSFDAADRAADAFEHSPREVIAKARRVLRKDGREGLEIWLRKLDARAEGAPRLLIVDASGEELLGRPVNRMSRRWLEREHRRGRPDFSLRSAGGERYRAVLAPPVVAIGPVKFESPRTPIMIVALLSSALVCFFLARTIVRPVRTIDAAAVRLRQGDLRARAEAHGGGTELVSLGRHFNAMAEQVEALLTSQRELLRNVSHELRSPLARLRVALELARGGGKREVDAMERIERETERLDHLIGQVLRLSRVSDPSVDLPRETVDLVAVLESIVDDARFEVGERNVDIEFSTALATAHIDAEPELVASAIENVVRNAVHHSPVGGTVRVALIRDDDVFCITIDDEGPGVPVEHLSAIFEPFFRSEAARERGSGGDGVGLAITRAVVSRLGGDVHAQNKPSSGLIVTLRFPDPAPGKTAPA